MPGFLFCRPDIAAGGNLFLFPARRSETKIPHHDHVRKDFCFTTTNRINTIIRVYSITTTRKV